MSDMIAQAVNAKITPMKIAIIYFFAFSVFSSSPVDMTYMIPTTHIPRTAAMAAISCNIETIDEKKSLIHSSPDHDLILSHGRP